MACGTTGEAATLTADEHFGAVRVCVDRAKRRVPVIAGAGSNDTRVAAQNLAVTKAAGADATLVVAPSHNRPRRKNVYQHFAALAHATELPLILYNVPARTVTDVQPATLARIVTEFPDKIVAIEDLSGVLARVSEHQASLLCPLDAALFTHASPGATKYALSRVRFGCPEGLRLQMTRPG